MPAPALGAAGMQWERGAGPQHQCSGAAAHVPYAPFLLPELEPQKDQCTTLQHFINDQQQQFTRERTPSPAWKDHLAQCSELLRIPTTGSWNVRGKRGSQLGTHPPSPAPRLRLHVSHQKTTLKLHLARSCPQVSHRAQGGLWAQST